MQGFNPMTARGNRLNMNNGGAVTNYVYNNLNQLTIREIRVD